jgi:hypothetical protein
METVDVDLKMLSQSGYSPGDTEEKHENLNEWLTGYLPLDGKDVKESMWLI